MFELDDNNITLRYNIIYSYHVNIIRTTYYPVTHYNKIILYSITINNCDKMVIFAYRHDPGLTVDRMVTGTTRTGLHPRPFLLQQCLVSMEDTYHHRSHFSHRHRRHCHLHPENQSRSTRGPVESTTNTATRACTAATIAVLVTIRHQRLKLTIRMTKMQGNLKMSSLLNIIILSL